MFIVKTWLYGYAQAAILQNSFYLQVEPRLLRLEEDSFPPKSVSLAVLPWGRVPFPGCRSDVSSPNWQRLQKTSSLAHGVNSCGMRQYASHFKIKTTLEIWPGYTVQFYSDWCTTIQCICTAKHLGQAKCVCPKSNQKRCAHGMLSTINGKDKLKIKVVSVHPAPPLAVVAKEQTL